MPPESLSEFVVPQSSEFAEPQEIKPSFLLPTVPASVVNYTPTQGGKVAPVVDSSNLLDTFLKKGMGEARKGAPLYDYKTKQEERYNNPFMQFTPNAQGSYSTEDAYGKKQGAGEQLYNSIIKTGAKAGASFISGFTDLPKQIDAIRSGSNQLFTDGAFTQTQEWLKDLEDKYPNYLTQVETDRSWVVNAFTPTGAANFWGDTVLKNMGSTVGALANAVVVDAGISLLTAGTATPVALIAAGKQLSNAVKGMKAAYRGLAKGAVLGKIDDVVGLATSQGILGSLNTTNKAFGIKKAAQLTATTYFSSQGESMIEGYQTYVDTKTDLLEKAYQEGKPFTSEFLKGIDDTASAAGKNTMLLNLAITSASNLVQFPKLLGWAKGADVLEKASADYVKLSGLKATNEWSKKAAYKALAKDVFFKGIVSEGLEEGSQYFVGNSLHDYYLDKFDNKTTKGMAEYLVNAVPKTLQEGDFWKEVLIGGLTGAISGAVIPGGEIQNSIKENIFGAERQQGITETINKDLDLFRASVGELSSLEDSLTNQSRTDQFQNAYKSLYRTVSNAAKFGKVEDLKSNLEDLNDLTLEEYNKAFYQDPTQGLKSDLDKSKVINKLITEVEQIQDEKIAVEKSFKSNPFSNNKVKDLLVKKFKVDQSKVSTVQQKLFEDWKENQSYLLGRLRNTQSDVYSLQEEIKLGNNNPQDSDITYATLVALSDKDTISSYLGFKNRQIESLKNQKDYYSDLGDTAREKITTNQLKGVESLYSEIGKNLDSPETLQRLILEHEYSGTASGRSLEEKMRQIEEARLQEEMIRATQEELIRNADNPEQSATDMVETLGDLDEAEQANNPNTEPIDFGPHQYYFLRTLNSGDIVEFNGKKYILGDNKGTYIGAYELGNSSNTIAFGPAGYTINGVTQPYNSEITKFVQETPVAAPTPPLVQEPVNEEERVLTDEEVEIDVYDAMVRDKAQKEIVRKENQAKLDGLIKGKELVKAPKKEGGRYIIKGTLATADGYSVWTLTNGNLVMGGEKLSDINRFEFYSLNGEPVIEQEPVTDLLIPESSPDSTRAEYVTNYPMTFVTDSAKLFSGQFDRLSNGNIIVKHNGVNGEFYFDPNSETEVFSLIDSHQNVAELKGEGRPKKGQVQMTKGTVKVKDGKIYLDKKIVLTWGNEIEKEKVKEKEPTLEEKIDFFSKNASNELKQVLLQSVQNNLINLDC
jgi:hypothetical protein